MSRKVFMFGLLLFMIGLAIAIYYHHKKKDVPPVAGQTFVALTQDNAATLLVNGASAMIQLTNNAGSSVQNGSYLNIGNDGTVSWSKNMQTLTITVFTKTGKIEGPVGTGKPLVYATLQFSSGTNILYQNGTTRILESISSSNVVPNMYCDTVVVFPQLNIMPTIVPSNSVWVGSSQHGATQAELCEYSPPTPCQFYWVDGVEYARVEGGWLSTADGWQPRTFQIFIST